MKADRVPQRRRPPESGLHSQWSELERQRSDRSTFCRSDRELSRAYLTSLLLISRTGLPGPRADVTAQTAIPRSIIIPTIALPAQTSVRDLSVVQAVYNYRDAIRARQSVAIDSGMDDTIHTAPCAIHSRAVEGQADIALCIHGHKPA